MNSNLFSSTDFDPSVLPLRLSASLWWTLLGKIHHRDTERHRGGAEKARFFVRLRVLACFIVRLCALALFFPLLAMAHPLGNFTVNHYARLSPSAERLTVRYVVDMAEIPAFQELQRISGQSTGAATPEQLNAYAAQAAAQYAAGLRLTLDGVNVPLQVTTQEISTPAGQGNLPTLRLVCDFAAAWPSASQPRRVAWQDTNHSENIGWRELAVIPADGVSVFDSKIYGNNLTDELKVYPETMLAAPLNERAGEFSFVVGPLPTNTQPLKLRDGANFVPAARDRFAELIAVKELTAGVIILGLLLAMVWGAMHALSPGHGKTVVGAYLVGARGTPRHAAFLGLTVTITHTASVFALGLIALFASHYILPEKLFPVLSLLSGVLVLGLGVHLFVRRLRGALGLNPLADHHHHHHDLGHAHEESGQQAAGSRQQAADSKQQAAFHSHSTHAHGGHTHTHDGHTHSHDGHTHSHLPPESLSWRSLLALGISGGLLPCPSALVVMLSAITLNRVGYGLALVVAFSVGLAGTLTAIGLAFVYAGRVLKERASNSTLLRVLPALSAAVIAALGLGLCYQALLLNDGYLLHALQNWWHAEEPSFATLSAPAILGLGLIFGLKHATEADHVVAVTTIVSEQGNLLRAALVGAWWGTGHTLSLVVVGALVLGLRVTIPEHIAHILEFCVALMIIGLGLNAVRRAWQQRNAPHVHAHRHDGVNHAHVHTHVEAQEHAAGVQPDASANATATASTRIGFKPLLVGAMHGLAGSAGLTVLVLTQIPSPLLGLLALLVFGAGSIIGMLLMSGLLGLPFALSSTRLNRANFGLQFVAGILSVAFGLWYAYDTGIFG